jgi:hypothetical protein
VAVAFARKIATRFMFATCTTGFSVVGSMVAIMFFAGCAPSIGPVLFQIQDGAVSDAIPQGDAPRPFFRPEPGTRWQIQLTGSIDTALDVQMYAIDLFTASNADIAALHSAGRVVICWLSVGSYEPWRPDIDAFPPETLGASLGGRGEVFVDIRDPRIRTIVAARLDLAVARGCDGVIPANVDGYDNRSGFDLTAEDQLAYNRWVATEAHARSLSVGLVNDPRQAPELASSFDWAMTLECVRFSECDAFRSFIDSNKAVFHVEYSLALSDFCRVANSMNFDSLKKNVSLDAYREACR